MVTTAVYITVRLGLESAAAVISDEEVQDLINEVDYGFTAPEGCGITIIDTEICGLNE